MTPLAWLFALAGIVSLDSRIITPILPAVAATLGVSAGEVGYAVTAYSLSYGSMQLVYGPLSDRFGRIRVVRAAAVLFALATALSALAGSTWQFVGARFVAGGFAAATIPTTMAYIGDTVRYGERQHVVGRFGAIMSTAQALSAALAGLVTHVMSWRVMFAGYAALALLPVGALFRAHEAPRAPVAGAVGMSYPAILALAPARRIYLAAITEGFLVWGGTTYLGVLASRRFGFNELQVGLLIACYGIGTIVGGVTLARVIPVLGERALASRGGAVQAAAWATLLPALPWPVFALALVALGLGFAWLHTTLQTRATELAPAARAKAFSLFPLAFSFGAAVGTAGFGTMVDAGMIHGMLATCAAGTLAVGWYTARRN